METNNTNPAVAGIIRDEKGRFPKGVSGNPAGRAEGTVSIVEGIKRKLQDVEPEKRKTYLDLFLSKLFQKAIKEGNEQLMRDMIDRVDGKPVSKNEVYGKDGEKLEVLVIVKDGNSP